LEFQRADLNGWQRIPAAMAEYIPIQEIVSNGPSSPEFLDRHDQSRLPRSGGFALVDMALGITVPMLALGAGLLVPSSFGSAPGSLRPVLLLGGGSLVGAAIWVFFRKFNRALGRMDFFRAPRLLVAAA
jgi:hypothetical protein